MEKREVRFLDLGTKRDYQEIWDFQEVLLKNIVDAKMQRRKTEKLTISSDPQLKKFTQNENHLLFVEHPHVYTLGKSGHLENMLANQEKLNEINATFVRTNRGGDITYHGPGQLVAYPVLDLEDFKEDLGWYMRSLEEIIIKTIAHYGLKGERSKGETGVWLDTGKPYARKICAMGVKTSRWVTMHGLALNVNTDLRYFEYIVPCGIQDKSVTSLQRELDRSVSMDEVKTLVKKYFEEIFEAELT